MNENSLANTTEPEPPPEHSRRGFLLKTLSALGVAILAVFGRKDRLAAATIYAPPMAYRVFLPQAMRDAKDPNSDKDPSEKDPISDKDPSEKDPTSDKDPNEKQPGEKDPNEKDPISDKNPSEKDEEGQFDRPWSPSRGLLFDEWGPR